MVADYGVTTGAQLGGLYRKVYGPMSVMHKAKAKLGSGGRFRALRAKLASRPGVRDPDALAAAIGRKKYGAARFAKLGR